MNKARIPAIITLILILLLFGIMIAALIMANYNLFFIAGGVLVAAIIVGAVLVKTVREKQKDQDEK